MKVEVLGTGCQKCEALAHGVKTALDGLGVQYELVKVTDITEIMKYGVMITPALVIDGEVKISGKVPTVKEIQDLVQAR